MARAGSPTAGAGIEGLEATSEKAGNLMAAADTEEPETTSGVAGRLMEEVAFKAPARILVAGGNRMDAMAFAEPVTISAAAGSAGKHPEQRRYLDHMALAVSGIDRNEETGGRGIVPGVFVGDMGVIAGVLRGTIRRIPLATSRTAPLCPA